MIAKIKRSLWVGGMAAIACLVMAAVIMGIGAMSNNAHADNDSPEKVFVCKYSGEPGINEKLKDGKQPISVSVNTLKGFDGTFPWSFPDKQGQSIAIAYDHGQDLNASDCPAPTTPPVVPPTIVYSNWVDGEPNCSTQTVVEHRTVTTTTYTVTWKNGEWVVTANAPVITTQTQTRELTYNEWLACRPKDATAAVWVSEATCESNGVLHYGATNHASFTGGTPNGTSTPGAYDVVATAVYGHLFANGTSIEHLTGTIPAMLTGEQCEQEGPSVATASVTIVPATCKAGEMLVYSGVTNATAMGTADGTTGPVSYSVTFTASDGSAFAGNKEQLVFTGTLKGASTDPSCEQGTVLGSSTTTPGQAASTTAPAVLPETDGEAGTAVIFGGSLLAVIAAAVGIRRLSSRGL